MTRLPPPQYLHAYLSHPCHVRQGPGPDLVVTCASCGSRLRADRISKCSGDGQDERVLLYLLCDTCHAVGQLRLQWDAFGKLVPPVPSVPPGPVEVMRRGSAYLSVRCTACDPNFGAGVLLLGHIVESQDIVLVCQNLRCGHSFALRTRRTPGFAADVHEHLPPEDDSVTSVSP